MIFLTSTFPPMHTSTQKSMSTTTASPNPSTTTHLNPTSTEVSKTTLSTHLLNLSTTTETAQMTTHITIHTTTRNQSKNLTTSQTFVNTTAPLSRTTKPVNKTLTYNETTTASATTTASETLPDTFVNTSTTTYTPTTDLIATTSTTSTIETTTLQSQKSTTDRANSVPITTTIKVGSKHNSTQNRTIDHNLRHRSPKSVDSSDPHFGIILVCILVIVLVTIIYIYKKRRNKKERRESTILPTTDEPLDPIIENILEEQDLKNQLRINAWRMAKLHNYLKKKNPHKQKLVESMEKNAMLMEKINIQIKNSPVLIYKKRGKKKDEIPTLTADLIIKKKEIPTMRVDLMTALKEPDKVKHISSIAKLRINMLPVEYEHRRKRKNFKPLKEALLPVRPKRPRRKAPVLPRSELEVLKDKKLVSNSIFKN
jgi:hypothetical protein